MAISHRSAVAAVVSFPDALGGMGACIAHATPAGAWCNASIMAYLNQPMPCAEYPVLDWAPTHGDGQNVQ